MVELDETTKAKVLKQVGAVLSAAQAGQAQSDCQQQYALVCRWLLGHRLPR
jgi:hypothetical protein